MCGGRPRFLVSRILKCGVCGASYVMKNLHDYGCAGYVEGRDCRNSIGVHRFRAEEALPTPVYDDIFKPERIVQMAKELQTAYLKDQLTDQQQANRVPAEVQAIDEKIERLRARLRGGDPDIGPEEIEAALSKAQERRRMLLSQASAPNVAQEIAMLPTAAADFSQQIKLGLAGDRSASLRARVTLRLYFGEQFRMLPEAGGALYAEYLEQ